MRLHLSKIIFTMLACGLVAGAAGADEVDLSLWRSFEQETDSPLHYLYLHDTRLIEGSDSLFVNDKLMGRDKDYVLDYADGIVYFIEEVPASYRVRVVYRIAPPVLVSRYRLRKVEERYNSRRLLVEKPMVGPGGSNSYDIRASGSKSIKLEAGSLSDIHVSQALDLKISGKVSGVGIKAILSDRDMAAGDMGSTSRLKDLDRIFIEVSAQNAMARVGDLELKESPGELLTIRRQGTGFLFKGFSGSKYLAASGVTARTKSRTVVIALREGISGPYAIPQASGTSTRILNNSEQVFLDGRKLKRGQKADYTIDYDKAEIYLNPRITVRDGSRLTLTYDVENEADDQLYYITSGSGLGKRAKVNFTYVAQAGKKLTQEPSLALLGSGMTGWKDGGRFVGMGKGSYIKVSTDTCSYYLYVGEGSGDYDVEFTEVGEGKGTYSYVYSDIWQKYVYVFTGLGSFIDRIPATDGYRSNIFHMGASFEPAQGLRIETELAQANSGDKIVDEDAKASARRAYRVVLEGESPGLSLGQRNLGRVGVGFSRSVIGSGYDGLDRHHRPGFYEKWAQQQPQRSEEMDEISFSYHLGEGVSALATLGKLRTDEALSQRKGIDAGLEISHFAVKVKSSRIEVEGKDSPSSFAYDLVGIRIPIGIGELEGGRLYDAKVRPDSVSNRRYEYYVGFGRRGSLLEIAGRISHSKQQRSSSQAWMDYLDDWTAKTDIKLAFWKRANLKAGIVHRRLDYGPSSDLPDTRITAADVHVDMRNMGPVGSLSLDYELTRRLTSIYAWELVKLNGVGDYDSLGNYVPGGGTYGILRKNVGSEPANYASIGMNLDVGRRANLIPKRNIFATTRIRLETESRSKVIWDYAIPLGSQSDDILSASADVRQEIVYRGKGRFSIRFGGRYLSRLNHQYIERSDAKQKLEFSSKIMGGGPFAILLSLEARVGKTQSFSQLESRISKSERRESMACIGLERRLGSSLRALLDLELSDEKRQNPDSYFLRATVKPGLSLVWNGIRWDSFCRVRRILRSRNVFTVGYPLGDSLEWNSRLNLARGGHLSLSFEYNGMKIKGSPAIHNMRSSLTATF